MIIRFSLLRGEGGMFSSVVPLPLQLSCSQHQGVSVGILVERGLRAPQIAIVLGSSGCAHACSHVSESKPW